MLIKNDCNYYQQGVLWKIMNNNSISYIDKNNNFFWNEVYYCMQEQFCSKEEAIEIVQSKYNEEE